MTAAQTLCNSRLNFALSTTLPCNCQDRLAYCVALSALFCQAGILSSLRLSAAAQQVNLQMNDFGRMLASVATAPAQKPSRLVYAAFAISYQLSRIWLSISHFVDRHMYAMGVVNKAKNGGIAQSLPAVAFRDHLPTVPWPGADHDSSNYVCNVQDRAQCKVSSLDHALALILGCQCCCRFAHLVNYGGSYYSYAYAMCLASSMWKLHFQTDPLSRSAGETGTSPCTCLLMADSTTLQVMD